MPTERISELPGPSADPWTALIIAKEVILAACGPPPTGCRIDTISVDHDLGIYPVIALHWDEDSIDESTMAEYALGAENALFAVDLEQMIAEAIADEEDISDSDN